MDDQQHESAGSSSAVEQHHTSGTAIRSRRYATDVAESITAPSDPSVPEDNECVKEQADNDPNPVPESSRRSASPPLATSESATPAQEPEPETKSPEEKQCRICLAGAEEETELGRLISPCLCRGSIRYVHVNCLKQWRTMSQSRGAFWSCPQCGFKYALARTRAVGLAKSPVILSTASMVLFTLIVLLSSFLGTYFVPDDALNEPLMTNRRESDSFFGASFGGVVFSPLDYYTYSWDTAKDVFKLAVQTFSDIPNLEEEFEFWKRDDDEPERDEVLDDSKYERVHTSGKGFKSTVKIPQKTRGQRQKSPKRKHRSPPSRFERFVRWFIYRFMTGLGVVGILSFLNLLFSVGLVAPLRFFAGSWNRGQRRAAANDTASLVVIIVTIIG
ncbi:hypothetical protein RSAG8_01987, partial [Rhizoctonia solani AG-8 WAC10335]